MESTHHFRDKYFLCAQLLLFLLAFTSQFVSCQKGDGAVITRSNFQALKAVKNELIDSKGFLRSWNDSGSGACSGKWAGIKCANGQVIAIQLPWRGLGGKISEKIGQLQALRTISLHDNALTGTIPWSLGNLHNLRGVYLFNNHLSGSIPASIGNCPALQTLDVSNNSLNGMIPPSIGNSYWLYRLNMSFNSLMGPIPASLTFKPSLTILALQNNYLSGPIPDSWGGAGTGKGNYSYQLQHLTVDKNRLSGTIPVSLGKMDLLQEVSLSNNQISGPIPNDLGRLSRLQKLDLSNNSINGSFPSSFSNLSSLISLNLEGNLLDNQIPEDFDRLQNLIVLNLKNNKFRGPIPATIGNIFRINQLDLAQNGFSGEIPASFSHLANLTSFNVSYNNLFGVVPTELSKKFDSSSFVGNLQLCGYSSTTPCPLPSPSPVILPSPSSEAPKPNHHKLSTEDIILIAAGALLAVLLLLCCILLCCLMRKKAVMKQKKGINASRAVEGKTDKSVPDAGVEVESGGEMGGKLVHFEGPFVFTVDDLLCATAEIMGKSNYGTTYKATLEDGNQVAVKRLREKNTKGHREFENEAAALGKIRHQNLLALRAYYLGPKGEKLLVFDYMPRGSLSSFFHAREPETIISWPTRMSIAMGVARGLNYLHAKENMIHGNLTSSNVLLDEQTNPQIADFGVFKLMTAAANANVIATAGTLGYLAPELSKLKNANTKTDVYSLGVIILELLTGKSPNEPTNGMDLPQWVASIVKEEWTNEVFDLELMRDAPTIEDKLLNTLELALHCVDPTPSARPEVGEVLKQLEEIQSELPAGSADDGDEVPTGSE